MINLHKVVQNDTKIIKDIIKNYFKTNYTIDGKYLLVRRDKDKDLDEVLADIKKEPDYVILNIFNNEMSFDEFVLIRPERYPNAKVILKNTDAEVLSIPSSEIKDFPKHSYTQSRKLMADNSVNIRQENVKPSGVFDQEEEEEDVGGHTLQSSGYSLTLNNLMKIPNDELLKLILQYSEKNDLLQCLTEKNTSLTAEQKKNLRSFGEHSVQFNRRTSRKKATKFSKPKMRKRQNKLRSNCKKKKLSKKRHSAKKLSKKRHSAKKLSKKRHSVKKCSMKKRSIKKRSKKRHSLKHKKKSRSFRKFGGYGLQNGPSYSGVYPMSLKVIGTMPNLNNIKRSYTRA